MKTISLYKIYAFKKLNGPIVDVRSEGEYQQGHIPGSLNLPLMNNEERKQVGICYKQKGNYEAVLMGYELVGHKFKNYIQQALEICPNKTIGIYCFRGGLRSRIMSNLLQSAGFNVIRLDGGYKAYRKDVFNILNLPKNMIILGGYTGSQKTEKLSQLKALGHQAIDLEKLANHKGSAYGGLGQQEQPTNEQFENMLASEWENIDPLKPLWMEDESSRIGKINIPKTIYIQMRESMLLKVEVAIEKRLNYILSTYGKMPVFELYDATKKLELRLGGEQCNVALGHLQNGELKEWLIIVLNYYDRTYNYGNSLRDSSKIKVLSEASFDLLYKI